MKNNLIITFMLCAGLQLGAHLSASDAQSPVELAIKPVDRDDYREMIKGLHFRVARGRVYVEMVSLSDFDPMVTSVISKQAIKLLSEMTFLGKMLRQAEQDLKLADKEVKVLWLQATNSGSNLRIPDD